MRYVICLFLCMVLTHSCTDKNKIKHQLNALYENPIIVPSEMMELVRGFNEKDRNRCKHRFVVYMDSTRCSSCAIKRVRDWELLREDLNEEVDLVFIFAPKEEEYEKVKGALSKETISADVYVDKKHAFIRENPYIPSTHKMHVFLLTPKDSVILVGNPLNNNKIRRMLYDVLEKKSIIQRHRI